MSDDPVKVYSLSTCSHCKSVKKLMDECTVKYEFVDVDRLLSLIHISEPTRPTRASRMPSYA